MLTHSFLYGIILTRSTITRNATLESYYSRHREYCKAKSLAYRLSRPEYILWQSCKHRAKAKQLEFTLTINDIKIPETCPVFGIKLILGGQSDNSPSVDRINNSKGYTPDNICIISTRANKLKNNATIEELGKVIDYMKT